VKSEKLGHGICAPTYLLIRLAIILLLFGPSKSGDFGGMQEAVLIGRPKRFMNQTA
jgi:Sec-independent protein translocase protein TatA